MQYKVGQGGGRGGGKGAWEKVYVVHGRAQGKKMHGVRGPQGRGKVRDARCCGEALGRDTWSKGSVGEWACTAN